jgi:cystathionine beta-synthase
VDYANSLLDLIGNTPLLRLRRSLDDLESPLVLAKVEYLNPGRVGEGPDRDTDDRCGRGLGRAAARRHDRRADFSGNTGVGLAMVAQQRGYKCVFVCPDKVSEDKRNVLKAYGAEVVVCPTAVAPEHPDSYYNVSDRLVSEPGAWKPDQYSNPHNPALALRDDRPGDLGADRRQDHPLRGRRRHRRHDQRHRTLSQGAQSPRPGDRRRPGRLGLLRRHRAPLPGRGRRRGLLARDLRPPRRRPDHRGLRRGLVRDDPPTGREEALLVGGSAGMAAFAAAQLRELAKEGRDPTR